MNIPKDNMMLISVINTALRDKYPSLNELCTSESLNEKEISDRMMSVGYEYDPVNNRFV
ncbi:MAG: DUF4250 domain-containing protein [Lachnospiraceae bacterium]|nr:DUF4250 domain-containing protein [Lachnospiraceae bacterium]